jgi:hypothetical protein
LQKILIPKNHGCNYDGKQGTSGVDAEIGADIRFFSEKGR